MKPVRQIIETPTFQRQADDIWNEDERLDFIVYIAANPLAGDVVKQTGGARKVRWTGSSTRPGGKSGGVRVIYYDYLKDGTLVLVMMYPKKEKDDVTPREIEKAK